MDMAYTVEQFLDFLKEEEKSDATISKYTYELQMFLQFLGKREIGKELMIQYRTYLSSRYRPQTVNGKLSAVNAFLKFTGLYEYRVKFLKVQRRAYIDETRELTQKEYERLMETAGRQGKYQLYYLMMTICSTGIRVSELRYVTVEAVMRGKAEIFMKGKYRIVIFPKNLAAQLKAFARKNGIRSGSLFCTRSGRPLDRSNICHAMKRLCAKAGVKKDKVFPHNFRHLFARSFYAAEKNMAHLADILGHSSIETTRIYVAASIKEHEKILNKLKIGVINKLPQNKHSVVYNSLVFTCRSKNSIQYI